MVQYASSGITTSLAVRQETKGRHDSAECLSPDLELVSKDAAVPVTAGLPVSADHLSMILLDFVARAGFDETSTITRGASVLRADWAVTPY